MVNHPSSLTKILANWIPVLLKECGPSWIFSMVCNQRVGITILQKKWKIAVYTFSLAEKHI